jgi:hypothetical protein
MRKEVMSIGERTMMAIGSNRTCILGTMDFEDENLIRQAAYLAPTTEQVFREAGIGRGNASLTSAPASETWPCWLRTSPSQVVPHALARLERASTSLYRPGKTKRGKNYAKAPEELEAVETGQQRPMPPGFPGGSLRATSISRDRCGRSRFSRGSENPRRQPTRFQADPGYSLSTERSPVCLWALSVILPRFVFLGQLLQSQVEIAYRDRTVSSLIEEANERLNNSPRLQPHLPLHCGRCEVG